MKKPVALIALTTAGFAAGLGVGLWIGLNHVPTPPPPAWVFTEFKNVTRPGMTLARLVQARPNLWRAINAELQALRPQIEDFRNEIETIDSDFRRDLEAILSDAQKQRLELAQKQKELPRLAVKDPKKETPPTPAPAPAAPAAKPPAAPAPSPAVAAAAKVEPDKQPKVYWEAIDGMVAGLIFVPYTHERFTQVLSLDERQQVRLRDLLNARRTRFLALADEMAPPSLQLSRIADLIRKAEAETDGKKP